MKQKRTQIKWLLTIEVLVFYFCLLNLISHIKGPTPYYIDTSNIIVPSTNFQSFFDMSVSRTDDVLHLLNTTEGTAAGYQSKVRLENCDGIDVSFQIDCPEQYAGSTVVVDLYNAEAGFDSPNQEEPIILTVGQNEIEVILSLDETAPNQACLRIFTLEQADYDIVNLVTYPKMLLPKVSHAIIISVVASGVVLLCTVCFCFVWKNKLSRALQ